jgi:hypothetical protein
VRERISSNFKSRQKRKRLKPVILKIAVWFAMEAKPTGKRPEKDFQVFTW